MRRRDFIASIAAAGLAPPALPAARVLPAPPPLLAAFVRPQGNDDRHDLRHAPAFAGRIGGARVALPARGHGVLADPANSGAAWVCARRPGDFLWRIDTRRGRVLARYEPDATRRIEGHVVLDPQARLLYATQTDTDTGTGVLAVLAADTLDLRAELPTFGIGPHELCRRSDGALLVANGGVLTLPETGRVKLNVDTMRSTVALIDTRGTLLAEFESPGQRLGMRHLAVGADGTTGIAMQYEQPNADAPDRAAGSTGSAANAAPPVPVLALLRPGATRVALAEVSPALCAQLHGYAASICATADGFVVACPRGDRLVAWKNDGSLAGSVAIPGATGLAADREHVFVSNESGDVWVVDPRRLAVQGVFRSAATAWDNHLARLPG